LAELRLLPDCSFRKLGNPRKMKKKSKRSWPRTRLSRTESNHSDADRNDRPLGPLRRPPKSYYQGRGSNSQETALKGKKKKKKSEQRRGLAILIATKDALGTNSHPSAGKNHEQKAPEAKGLRARRKLRSSAEREACGEEKSTADRSPVRKLSRPEPPTPETPRHLNSTGLPRFGKGLNLAKSN